MANRQQNRNKIVQVITASLAVIIILAMVLAMVRF